MSSEWLNAGFRYAHLRSVCISWKDISSMRDHGTFRAGTKWTLHWPDWGWCEQQCNKKVMLVGSRGLHSLLELAWQILLISLELLPEVQRFGTRQEIGENYKWMRMLHLCESGIWGRLSGSYSKGRNALSRTPPSGRKPNQLGKLILWLSVWFIIWKC